MFDAYYLPRHLNQPKRVLLFTFDECFALFLPALLFQLLFDAWWLGACLGIGLVVWLKRLKGIHGPYYLSAFCYWFLPSCHLMRFTPPSHLRHWIG